MFYDIEPDDKLALVSSAGERLTYSDLAQQVDRIVGFGLERDLCFHLCENSPSSVAGYLGLMRSGVVPLLLDRKTTSELLGGLLSTYTPRYLSVPATMVDDFAGYHVRDEYMSYAMLEADEYEPCVLHDDLALLLTTSGSTGSPKLVRQSYRNLESNTAAIVEYLAIGPDERAITTLPMNYTYGHSIISSHLLAHATILLTDDSMNMKPFWNFFKQEEATSFGGVPFTYQMLKRVRFFKMDLPSLRYMTQAGGKLPPELHTEFATWAAERGKRFIVMYGQTEATARMGYLPAEKSIEKAGSMGIAIPGGTFTLIDVDGKPITTPNVTGELVYEGDNVTLGYAQCRDDLAKGDERNGRLETGDMARFDEDGYFYIVGRKKRFLKIFGNRVNLDEVDRLLATAFEDMNCASTGVDDRMVTFVTDESRVDAVRKWLSDTTRLSQSAFDVRYLQEIPQNEAGKVLYKNLPL